MIVREIVRRYDRVAIDLFVYHLCDVIEGPSTSMPPSLGESRTKLTTGRARRRYISTWVLPQDGVPVWANRHELDGDIAAHDHDFFEIALVTNGTATHIAADGDFPARAGSLVVVPPNQWHAYGDCDRLDVFDCFVAAELMEDSLSFLTTTLPVMEAVRNSAFPLPQRVHLDGPDLDRAIIELKAMHDLSPERRSPTQAIGHLLIYLDIIDRAWRDAVGHTQGIAVHPAVAASVKLLEADPGAHWTLADLSRATATERTHLVHLFRRDLGRPPMAYLYRLRVQTAARLLVQTDEAVSYIGGVVGWEDASYFSQRFKAAYGLSPLAYRKRALTGKSRYHTTEP